MALPLRLLDTGSAAAQAERRLLERAVAGRYRVVDLIARGGMGAIYRGWEHGLERHVAIKLLAPARSRDADDRGRFRREARILAGLSHPNIVAALAIGERDDACWFAMPCLSGGTLAERLAGGRRLPAEAVRATLLQLADALDYAHAHGVVHRDIKAENVVFDASGRPVLLDFGVATLRTSDHSRSEISKGMGTAAYMPPEQLMGSVDADGRADLYALGVLGFRMLTGRFPFEGSATEIAAQALTRDVPPVAAYAAGAPADLAACVDRCLERRPERRWRGGGDLRDALRPRAGTAQGRLGAWFRRLRGRRLPAAALLLL